MFSANLFLKSVPPAKREAIDRVLPTMNLAERLEMFPGTMPAATPLIFDFGPWIGAPDFSDILSLPEPRLLDLTKYYYSMKYTWFGPKPFEYFALNSVFRGGRRDTMASVLREEGKHVPFLEPLVIDTLNFVMTGKRDLPMFLMRMYMSDYYSAQDAVYPNPVVTKRYNSNELACLSSEEFFQRWISHPDGKQDLVWANKLLFGL